MKHIAVIVVARDRARQREALRAAVGLGLRGDRITVCACAGAELDAADPHIARAAATLAQLGHEVVATGEVPADADAVEVWT